MNSKEQKVVFINRSGSGQKIVVEDQASADALEQALNRYQDQQWVRASRLAAPELVREYVSSKEFRVILVSGPSTFRSKSSRLSLNSIQLKTKVPNAFIGMDCIAYISNATLTDQVEIPCTVTLDQNGDSVLDFSKPQQDEIKRFENWISATAA